MKTLRQPTTHEDWEDVTKLKFQKVPEQKIIGVFVDMVTTTFKSPITVISINEKGQYFTCHNNFNGKNNSHSAYNVLVEEDEPINYYEICKELAVKNAWIQQSVRKEVIRYDRFVIDEPLPQNQIELLKEGVTRFSFDLVNFFTIHEYLEMRKHRDLTTAN